MRILKCSLCLSELHVDDIFYTDLYKNKYCKRCWDYVVKDITYEYNKKED